MISLQYSKIIEGVWDHREIAQLRSQIFFRKKAGVISPYLSGGVILPCSTLFTISFATRRKLFGCAGARRSIPACTLES